MAHSQMLTIDTWRNRTGAGKASQQKAADERLYLPQLGVAIGTAFKYALDVVHGGNEHLALVLGALVFVY